MPKEKLNNLSPVGETENRTPDTSSPIREYMPENRGDFPRVGKEQIDFRTHRPHTGKACLKSPTQVPRQGNTILNGFLPCNIFLSDYFTFQYK